MSKHVERMVVWASGKIQFCGAQEEPEGALTVCVAHGVRAALVEPRAQKSVPRRQTLGPKPIGCGGAPVTMADACSTSVTIPTSLNARVLTSAPTTPIPVATQRGAEFWWCDRTRPESVCWRQVMVDFDLADLLECGPCH